MVILTTERTRLRQLGIEDAHFILKLLNEPSFIKNIGDRGVRTLDEAQSYILQGPVASYERFGFGLWLVEIIVTGEAAGMCGLLKRDALEDVDIGYAFLPQFTGQGYARECAAAVVSYAAHQVGLKRLVAVVDENNGRSIHLLEKLGFVYEKMVRLFAEDQEIKLFALNFAP